MARLETRYSIVKKMSCSISIPRKSPGLHQGTCCLPRSHGDLKKDNVESTVSAFASAESHQKFKISDFSSLSLVSGHQWENRLMLTGVAQGGNQYGRARKLPNRKDGQNHPRH